MGCSSGSGGSAGSAGSAMKVDLLPFLIANLPASVPFFSSLTFPVPDILSYSHELFHANDRLAALTFQVTIPRSYARS